jgi:hypothetical protein
MDAWAPMFAVGMGIPREQMVAMSVQDMAEHVEYWMTMREAQSGG